MAQTINQPAPQTDTQTDTPDDAQSVYGTQNWPSSLFESDRVCPLPQKPGHQPRPFTDWAAI